MSSISFTQLDPESVSPVDEIKVESNRIRGRLKCFVGKQGDFFVAMIPSMKVSGYGITEEEATEDLKFNTKLFFDDLFTLTERKRREELSRLGWAPKTFFRKELVIKRDFENTKNDFDDPSSVKSFAIQAA